MRFKLSGPSFCVGKHHSLLSTSLGYGLFIHLHSAPPPCPALSPLPSPHLPMLATLSAHERAWLAMVLSEVAAYNTVMALMMTNFTLLFNSTRVALGATFRAMKVTIQGWMSWCALKLVALARWNPKISKHRKWRVLRGHCLDAFSSLR